jgi:hypothetical protein
MNRGCLIGAFLLLAPSVVSAGDESPNLTAVYDRISRVLVTVEYKSELTFMGQSDEIEGRVIGLSIGRDEWILTDLTETPHFDPRPSAPARKPKAKRPITATVSMMPSLSASMITRRSVSAVCRLVRSHF